MRELFLSYIEYVLISSARMTPCFYWRQSEILLTSCSWGFSFKDDLSWWRKCVTEQLDGLGHDHLCKKLTCTYPSWNAVCICLILKNLCLLKREFEPSFLRKGNWICPLSTVLSFSLFNSLIIQPVHDFNCTFILLSAEWKSLLSEGSHPPVRAKDDADLINFQGIQEGGTPQ